VLQPVDEVLRSGELGVLILSLMLAFAIDVGEIFRQIRYLQNKQDKHWLYTSLQHGDSLMPA